MKKLRASSRADLLEAAACFGQVDASAAALFGFEPAEKERPKPGSGAQQGPSLSIATKSPGRKAALPLPEFPTQLPVLTFLRAVAAEALEADSGPIPVGDAITEKELRLPDGKGWLCFQPLIRWSRLGGWMRGRFSSQVEGMKVDTARLTRRICSGKPVHRIPRQFWRAWVPRLLILRDTGIEMQPYAKDAEWLAEQLKREIGKHSIQELAVSGPPAIGQLPVLRERVSILVLSAMGQYTREPDTQAAWAALGRVLAWRSHPILALTPCPRRRWSADLARVWPMVEWDASCRLPRRGAVTSASPAGDETALKRLLDHLSPAAGVDFFTLRAVRRLLGRSADVGLEWEAWRHKDARPGDGSFRFKLNEAYHERLKTRSSLASADAAIARVVGSLLIRQDKATCASVIALETELRVLMSDPMVTLNPEILASEIQRVVECMRKLPLDIRPGRGSREEDMPSWFDGFVSSLPPWMRKQPHLQKSLSAGLAQVHALLRPQRVELPPGLDAEVYAEESRLARSRSSVPVDYRLELAGDGGSAVVALCPRAQEPAPRGVALAGLKAAPGALILEQTIPENHQRVQLRVPRSLSLLSVGEPQQIKLTSSHHRITLGCTQRPELAERMWQDRYGLGMSFSIQGVSFAWRWIPPGTFLMGSPENENGRYGDEGPQHEVTHATGFWMAETPVTQAQWKAVMGKRNNPSEFKGDLLPVEKVTWDESRDFAAKLGALVPGFSPRLPQEEEWEHACRAGSQSAFYDGSACTQPEGSDPALEVLGWYSENSGGHTQVVKQNQPNAWGLFDLHGNVWEWCEDVWDENAYARKVKGQLPAEKGADRVLRGGSWYSRARFCRAAIRRGIDPGNRGGNLGFRLAAGQGEPGAAEQPGPERRRRG